MASLSRTLCKAGWATTNLIHDEIVIRPSFRFESPSELQELKRETEIALRNCEERKGLPPGGPSAPTSTATND